MKDVLFYQNYTPVADVSTAAFCIIYWFLLSSTYASKQKRLTMFKIANILVFAAAVTSIAYHQVIERLTEANVVWAYILRDSSYISLILTTTVMCIYICNYVEMEGIRKKILYVLVWGMFAVGSVLEIIGPFANQGFYIDADLQIHQNFYRDIFRLAYIYYLLVIVCLLIVYRRRFITRMFRCLRNVLLMAFLLMALESNLLSTSYTCVTYAFALLAVLFLFHYNSFDADTGTLDSKAFEAYIKDLGAKSFTMICIHLQDLNMGKMQKVTKNFLQLNDKFFRDCCTFRMSDNLFVTVYQDDRNKKADAKLAVLLHDIYKLYEEHHLEYQVVIIHSDAALSGGSEYLALNEFLMTGMPVNTEYHCEKKDIDNYLKSSYILSELHDIHIRQDLEDERVRVFCQPVLDTVTNEFTSAEALMRMELPGCGMVFPDQFIPLAEGQGYIHTLSKIILNKTCRQLKELEQEGYRLERVSVNFSIMELRDKNFCSDVIKIIKDSGVAFDKIAIELTESRNENDFENVKKIMTNLQGLGVKFYLDDFGTGYSNFERIIGLPIDIIKFDRSLTILAGKDEESRFLVGSFSDIFKKSNYQILFEGVEDEQDENQCKQMNAHYLQGYKYSRPIPMEQLTSFLKKVG